MQVTRLERQSRDITTMTADPMEPVTRWQCPAGHQWTRGMDGL